MAKKFNTGMLQGVMDNLVIDFHTIFSGTVSTSFSGVVPERPNDLEELPDITNILPGAANTPGNNFRGAQMLNDIFNQTDKIVYGNKNNK